MKAPYDKYYQTKNLFGEPYPELIEFFKAYPKRGKILDMGCGQGRDAIALARLGYSVSGFDLSTVGIEQMTQIGQAEKLDLIGQVGNIYALENFEEFDFILLNSMFHFTKKEKPKEVELIQKILFKMKIGSLLVICIQDSGNKVSTLNSAIDSERNHKRLLERKFQYCFEYPENGNKTDYHLTVIQK